MHLLFLIKLYLFKLIHLKYIVKKTKKYFIVSKFFNINTLTLILIKNMDKKKAWKGPDLKCDYTHRKKTVAMPTNEYVGLAMIYRSAKIICRKCYCRLPPGSTICKNKKCRNTDLRYKHQITLDSFHCPTINVLIDFKLKKIKK